MNVCWSGLAEWNAALVNCNPAILHNNVSHCLGHVKWEVRKVLDPSLMRQPLFPLLCNRGWSARLIGLPGRP